MIHPKISSPCRSPLRRKRQTTSGRTLIGSAKTALHDDEKIPSEVEDPVPVRYSDLYKKEKALAEMGTMFKKKKSYPVAPDGLIPNSTLRTVFKRKEIKSVEVKAFQLRLDILANLQINDSRNFNIQDDDDEWAELDDPDSVVSAPTRGQKTKGTVVSRQKDAMPDIFIRIQNESWWKQAKEEKPNLRSMLLYLLEILKSKQHDSYESACNYTVEIFRTYGIEPIFVNQILDILRDHLTKNEHSPLDISTIRTIAQFMIERKDIIIQLLEHALKCQPTDISRQEIVIAIKFITDVTNSDDIDFVFDNMSIVYDAPEENFSLKMLIKGIENKTTVVASELVNEDEGSNEVHPLLKKISEERWFPRGNHPITLDYVLDAIIAKLPDAAKTMLKTLTTHLVQLHRSIGYSNEQYDRVANALISLLSHTEADYRLIAATNLANLGKETKPIDIALLNSFINDPRILVRTECCDSLKKLTGITSDTVLTDCADNISSLQVLTEENFSLQSYLNEKNRVPTPPPVDEQPSLPIDEQEVNDDENTAIIEPEQNLNTIPIEKNEDITSVIPPRSPSPPIIEQPSTINKPPPPEPIQSSTTPTLPQPPIPVETNENQNSIPSHTPRSRKERVPIQSTRQRNQPISPTKTPVPDRLTKKRSSLLPNEPDMWDSYAKQNEITNEAELNTFSAPPPPIINQEQVNDPIQTIIEEHKQTVGFYRMIPNRRVLVPHRVFMDNLFADQSHIMTNQQSLQGPFCPASSMSLSDLNQNQQHLQEVEFVQLLSSLVVRAIQVHRQYERFTLGIMPASFNNVLSISQMPLHSSSNGNSPPKLPLIVNQRPTSRQFARIQTNVQAKAAKEGINIHKAQYMEGALSNLLKTTREQPKQPSSVSLSMSHPSISRQTDITHGWLLVQLLKSQGVFHSENHLQKIIESYPKFVPLLHKRIPQNLIYAIWNDPVMRQIASIFGNKQDESTIVPSTIKRSETKQSAPITDDEYSSHDFDYSRLKHRNDHKKKFLPPIRGAKMNLPRHVLKFGFREIEVDSSETSNNSSREESRSRSRKRRVYMHLMMSANENSSDRHESDKNQLRQMLKTDNQATSFMPIVGRPPMCH